MANSSLDQMSLFDMFEDFGVTPAETPAGDKPAGDKTAEDKTAGKETKGKEPKGTEPEAEKEAVPESEDTADDAATEEAIEETAKVEPKKPATVKKKASGAKKLSGPVKVIGTGWEFDYGDIGTSYDPKDVIKAAFNEGFKEVALASFTVPKEGSVIYVSTVGKPASSDSQAVNGDITVILARKASVYKAEDFPGLDADEVSLFDVTGKFVEANPEFKGCALHAAYGIAVPVFDNTYTLNKDSDGTVKVWKEDGVKEYKEAEAALLFNEDVTFYKSDAGVLFPSYQAKGKGITNIYMTSSDFGLTARETKDVTEKYALPATLYLETFGQRKELKAEDFDGKVKITKDELINWLKPQFRVFQSFNRKFDVIYEKAQGIISVAIISGEKGASAPRIEDTDIGVFTGVVENGIVTGLDFF